MDAQVAWTCRACGQPSAPAYTGAARCARCRNEARKERYHKDAKHQRQVRAWAKANPEKTRAANRAWSQRVRDTQPERALWLQARARATTKGIPFDITVEDIHIPTHCPVLGFPLVKSTGTWAPNSPSLDRLVPEKGYVRGNVFVISHRANQVKNVGTAAEHELVAAWIRNQK